MVVEPGTAAVRSEPAPGGIESGSAIDRKAFSLPPVEHLPASAGLGSTDVRMRFLTSRFVSAGNLPMMSAATPATCGVAIEVPESSAYPLGSQSEQAPLGTVESVLTPGAPRSTVVGPKFEKDARLSLWSVAATAMMYGLP